MANCSIEAGAALALDRLRPLRAGCPAACTKVFDTRFYLACAGSAEPQVDGNENVRVFWRAPARCLTRPGRGAHHLLPHALTSRSVLALFARFDNAVADARAHPIRTVTP